MYTGMLFMLASGMAFAEDPCLSAPRPHLTYGREFVVCVDATNGVRFDSFAKQQYIHLLPHQNLTVMVHHGAMQQIDVSTTGVHGTYVPGVQSAENEITPAQSNSQKGSLAPTTSQWSRFTFTPYQPGRVEITVKRADLTADTSKLTETIDKLQRTIVATPFSPDSSEEQDKKRLEAQVQSLEDQLDKRIALTSQGVLTDIQTDLNAISLSRESTSAEMQVWIKTITADVEKMKALTAPTETTGTLAVSVDKTHIGSLRMGFATIVGDAVDQSFAVGPNMAAGTQAPTNVLQSNGNGSADGELVLGYSQYLSRTPDSSTRFRPALYAAAGVVATGTAETRVDLSALKSFHFGVELGWDLLSFGVGPTLRQVTRLQDGWEVGDAVGDAAQATNGGVTNVTLDRWQPGFSLVVFAPKLAAVGGN